MRGAASDGSSPDREEPLLAELFARALEIPGEGREAFVEEACAGDPALAAELRALLASHRSAPGWLESLADRVLPGSWASIDAGPGPGTRVGPWEIREEVGAGGMGVVYKAWDRDLDRWVALKLLPPRGGAGSSEGLERMLREARAASGLDHPNIAVVHQVGTVPGEAEGSPGRPFIVMPFYEGETLRQKAARGPQPVERVLDWGIQIAGALERAHQAGIVHRDIKPANVLITDRDEVKVLDFGVATAVGDGTAGTPAGTPAYMSPEQARGEEVDGRADLWAVGVLLHELLTGERPPTGVDGRRTGTPGGADPASEVPPGTPISLVRALRSCLREDPDERYGTASELLADLRLARSAIDGHPSVRWGDRPGVAVLPFADPAPEPGGEYFADGLTEEVILQLSRIRGLRVISRASVMRLKGRQDPARRIADELGVRYVLEGTVRRVEDRLRVTTHLLDVRGGEHVWSERFEGAPTEVFAIQEQVARGIAEGLSIRLSPSESQALAERPITDLRAYESYLRARHEAWTFSRDALARASRHIENAVSLVGDNALLYSTLGHILAMAHEAGVDPGPATLARVDALADQVFALDPGSARGSWLRGFVAFQRGDMRTAIVATERAWEAAPADPDTLVLLGYLYAHVGRNDEARTLLLRAVEVDPLTPLNRCMPGFVDLMEGRFTAAVAAYEEMYRMDPESPFSALTFGWTLCYAGRHEEALGILDEAASRHPGTPFAAMAASLAHGLRGSPGPAVEALVPLEPAAAESEMFARGATHCCALAGDLDRAFAWLERAVGLGLLNEPFLARHDPFLNGLRDDPRFEVILGRVRDTLADLGPAARPSTGGLAGESI